MVATRNIKAGEEILTMYCGLQVPKAERHRNLLPYGIDPCRCRACGTTNQIYSDRRRKSICSFDMIGAKNLPPRAALKEFARLVKLIEKEKLHCLDIYPIALHWMGYFWGKVNQKILGGEYFDRRRTSKLYNWMRVTGDSTTFADRLEPLGECAVTHAFRQRSSVVEEGGGNKG
ncbi:uncharacterized protein C8R40DRAFT_1073847 [Lentinula edodes]|uniref:uncharacterized protein n=1 Tax=Lentinula edodes TaxID=5353 RepID=UPI001E8E93D1|nr:uncharacterized protein C8R40DRAFT_1073847 [Lentinula edodes]KAH7869719.1 hypothetical protein C8R40DRAFT_1073847 [Lentinula edodes]